MELIGELGAIPQEPRDRKRDLHHRYQQRIQYVCERLSQTRYPVAPVRIAVPAGVDYEWTR